MKINFLTPIFPMNPDTNFSTLKHVLAQEQDLDFAVLIGSRAEGNARPESDWDIALRWKEKPDFMDTFAAQETLRRKMQLALSVAEDKIDLIDLHRPSLVMRANVAERGIVLTGEASLAWAHFLNRTWRELEYYYWDEQHAA